ncbi:MAG TPA: S8 family serine peptidase, partial [Gemmatimonadaceae bacterium]
PTSFYAAARVSSRAIRAASRSTAPHYSSRGVVIMFRNDVLHVAESGSSAYRLMDVARSTAATMQARLATMTRGLPVSNVRVSPAILAAHITLNDPAQADSVIATLRADPSVASVSRDVILTVRDGAPRPQAATFARSAQASGVSYTPAGVATSVPSDPLYYAQSWGFNMVDLPGAWALTTGSPSVTVAVVDMGVRFDDPDVAASLTNDGYDFVSETTLTDLGYASPGQICGGATFTTINGDGDGPDPDPTDPNDISFDSTDDCWQPSSLGDHGLWTSGIIGATGNDARSVTGINWNVRIRPIRVLGITGDGIGFDVAQGILYAAGLPATGANGALVTAPSRSAIINLSLGGFGVDASDQAAVAAAVQAGSLVIASAGNETTDVPVYPAAYPGVIGVSAVGMDGVIASYSDGGSYVSLAAPGGEYRLDDNGGDGVLGPGWDFTVNQPTLLFGYGTSAAAPYVSGVAALLLAKEPGLTAAALTARLEQYASRPPNSTRTDNYGWGIVNAYNSLAQQYGPPRRSYVRLVNSATGQATRTVATDVTGNFAITQIADGTYQLQAGEDEAGDSTIGIPGRRLGWVGGAASPTVFTAASGQPLVQTAGVAIGVPMEAEPNDSLATANPLSVNSYVVGQITDPDAQDVYMVRIPAAGTYTFETSGVMGACGWGIELDTYLTLETSTGGAVASNDNSSTHTGPNCSKISTSLTAGTYYVIVTGSGASGLSTIGRYRLQVRSGT